MKKLTLIIIVLLVMAIPSLAKDIKTPNPGYFCATTIEALEFGLACEKNNDIKTMQKLMAAGIIEELEAGARFTIIDKRVFKGYVKIQCRCEHYPVWVVKEAIKK